MQCDKIAYDSYSEAQKVINQAKNIRIYCNGKRIKRSPPKKPKRVYKCEHCGKWHLTSKLRNNYKK
jgi:hypothetical protein